MATSPSFYLQSLDKDEAIAFVASLQKIKDHLNGELEWMTAQVQQKTSQLQGIETMLSEAADLGLMDSSAAAPPAKADTDAPPTSMPIELASAEANGQPPSPATSEISETIALATVEALTESSASPQEDSPENNATPASAPSSNSKRDAKPSKAEKSRPSRPKKPVRSTKPTSQKSQSAPADAPDLRQYLQSEFQNQSITDSVAKVLEDSPDPLSVSDVMTELFDGLSGDRYKRAKNSVTNVLSVGRSKGRWKSTGRGMYANNSVTSA